jgi:hypothetical protein
MKKVIIEFFYCSETKHNGGNFSINDIIELIISRLQIYEIIDANTTSTLDGVLTLELILNKYPNYKLDDIFQNIYYLENKFNAINIIDIQVKRIDDIQAMEIQEKTKKEKAVKKINNDKTESNIFIKKKKRRRTIISIKTLKEL